MSSKIEISRDLAKRLIKGDASKGANALQLIDAWKAMEELRALIAAPPELAELQAKLELASRMFDEVENSLADSCSREAELQATIAQQAVALERLKSVTNFKDAVACVFDNLKFAAANTRSKEWDDQLEELAEDVIDYAPEYKKQWKDIAKLCAEIERLKGGQGEPAAIYPRCTILKDVNVRTAAHSQPAPVAVVLPDRQEVESGEAYLQEDWVSGWNACINKVKELNK
jgi:predicted phage-related endonuclease